MEMNKKAYFRKIVVYAVYILLIASFQVSFPGRISLWGQTADLMLVFTVLSAYYYGFLDGIVVGLCIGAVRDCFSAPSFTGTDGVPVGTVGIGMLMMFVMAAIAATLFTGKIHRRHIFAFITVLVCTVFYKLMGHILIFCVSSFFSSQKYNLSLADILFNSLLPQLALNALAFMPLAPLLRFLGPYSGGVNPKLIGDDMSKGDGKWQIS